MQIIDLSKQNSIINQYMAEMRDKEYQLNRLLFRNNITRVGEMMAYEISKTLNYEERDVETPLGTAKVNVPADKIILATIFRAGLPFHNGFLHVFDHAGNAFVSAYREYKDDIPRHALGRRQDAHHSRPHAGHGRLYGAGLQGLPYPRHAQAHTRGLRDSRARGHRAYQEDLPRRQDNRVVRGRRPGNERAQIHRAGLRRRRRPLLRRQAVS